MGQADSMMGDVAPVTVTFLFTDIEGSTAMWEQEPEAMRVALQRHNALLDAAVAQHGGQVFKTVGDAFCVTFDHGARALAAAREIQTRLEAERWPTHTPLRVRVALHTGPAYPSGGDYFGTTVNRCARLLAVTRGRQTLLTSATEALVSGVLPLGTSLRDLGLVRLRDVAHPVHVFQLVHAGLPPEVLEIGNLADEGKLTAEPVARFRPIDLYEVPTLSAIVMQALQMMQDPDSDANAVQRVIARDPAISAKVLRVANSAFFGFSRRVASIADAIRVLGFNNVQGMIIGVAAFDAFRTERLNLTELWRHSITAATAARYLAPRVGCPADEAFMAGILHDIGKLIFAVQAELSYRRALELEHTGAMTSIQAERTLFEFTHPEVGETVAERWALPPKYVAAIAHHHDPDAAGDQRTFCALIGLADHAAHAALPSGAAWPPERDQERVAVSGALGLHAADWDECLRHVQEAQPNIEAFVGAIR